MLFMVILIIRVNVLLSGRSILSKFHVLVDLRSVRFFFGSLDCDDVRTTPPGGVDVRANHATLVHYVRRRWLQEQFELYFLYVHDAPGISHAAT